MGGYPEDVTMNVGGYSETGDDAVEELVLETKLVFSRVF